MEAYEALENELIEAFGIQDKDKLRDIISKYDIAAKDKDGGKDLKEKINMYLSDLRMEGLSPRTIDAYKLQLKHFTNYVQKPVEKITTQDIKIYLSQYSHLAANTINNKLSAIRTFLQWLVDNEYLERNPAAISKIKPPKIPKRLPKALTLEELELIREVCETDREKAMVEVLYSTGCRISEVQQMNINDIDFQNQSIRVIGKGDKERTVFFNVKALIYLKKYLNSRTDDDPALFVSMAKPHRRITVRTFQREIKKVAERAAVKKNIHPHVFRHTLATLMLENGADITTVQDVLGHASPKTTMIYAQRSEQKKAENYRRYAVQ